MQGHDLACSTQKAPFCQRGIGAGQPQAPAAALQDLLLIEPHY